ncbi:Ldh family oxidoreductase [Geodermatophilus sp. YIM 151500]|uniref:Ldh family oxidoreductase n=1 Tax=Geodermatophilus sp. YIM 151500 TaxID=2984531 RepID=UPI0021E4A0AC|nr:Ldh family oxidoreductase [Geodermatophilus sp. YIM 151500]MCV2488297.1 Ldh family oxidoreductase [Geodermatophilus sp. YIM 151500]
MSDARPASRRFPADLLHRQVTSVLSAWGMPDDLVETTAAVMVDTDLAGIDSHGIQMLTTYETLLRRGELQPAARPAVVRESAVSALVDGRAGLGHPAAAMGMRLAVDKAREAGVGLVGVRNSHHFGAAGHYAAIAADQGMLGLVTTTTRQIVGVPTRGALPRLGTNPIAFAAPTGPGRPPFLLDMSTTTVAVNKVRVYELNDRPLPTGWVLDGAGRSVTDPAAAVRQINDSTEGGLTALGGEADKGSHKGYGLGVAVQILAGVLTGSSFGPLREPGGPADIGHFFMALDPHLFRDGDDFTADLDAVVDVLHDTPPADPDLPVLVAGDPEAISRAERARTGIPVPDALVERIRGLCDRAGVPFLLDGPAPG